MGEEIQAVGKCEGGQRRAVSLCVQEKDSVMNSYDVGGIGLLGCTAPPECSSMSTRANKQHLALTQMFVTLHVVREAAPSVPVCGGSDRCFCMFQLIYYQPHAHCVPVDAAI